MNDCEWPEVPEFSCKLRAFTMTDLSQMHKPLLKLTELTIWETREPLHLDRLFPVRLENLSVLRSVISIENTGSSTFERCAETRIFAKFISAYIRGDYKLNLTHWSSVNLTRMTLLRLGNTCIGSALYHIS